MSETIRSGRRSIAISSPEKVMFPKPGLTKLDLARHYERVGGLMKPLLRDRPLTFEVFPDGIESEGYYMKSVPRHFPDWIGRTKVAKRGGSLTQVLAADAATLESLGRRLDALSVPASPFADPGSVDVKAPHWVEPALVAQIGFTEWTRHGRLRHPRFLGLRDDKSAAEVVRER